MRKFLRKSVKFSHQTRKFFDLVGEKWVKNCKNLQKFAFFSKNVQECALFDPVFCTPLRV
jgi:hypothetical protein